MNTEKVGDIVEVPDDHDTKLLEQKQEFPDPGMSLHSTNRFTLEDLEDNTFPVNKTEIYGIEDMNTEIPHDTKLLEQEQEFLDTGMSDQIFHSSLRFLLICSI